MCGYVPLNLKVLGIGHIGLEYVAYSICESSKKTYYFEQHTVQYELANKTENLTLTYGTQ